MKADPVRLAPGGPGIEPRWTSSAKTAVGTSLAAESRVWFTMSHGIFNEIYYPQIDQACIRDMGMIVTDGAGYFSEEKREAEARTEWFKPGVPGFKVTNTSRDGRYVIRKQIFTDPERSAVLQCTQFEATKGKAQDYRVHVILAPHLGNRGWGNTGWTGNYRGEPMLFAQRKDWALALACSAPWDARSVGFAGSNDGWHDLRDHGKITANFTRAENGNIALTAEIKVPANGEFLLALGFGATPEEAAENARASLADGGERSRKKYTKEWSDWQESLKPAAIADGEQPEFLRQSVAVLRAHDSKFPKGGLIASLSIPWGFSKTDKDLGGYHLVWPRDLVETAGALLAIGAHEDVRCVLEFLKNRQAKDGHWAQNMWIDGEPYWNGSQLDETAFPILLVAMTRERGALSDAQARGFWNMVRNAASFTVHNGPLTCQDRWEEQTGYSPFTLAVAIPALLAAADMAEENHAPQLAEYWRETADYWHDSIERWTYVEDTALAREVGVPGYYVRIAPHEKGAWEPSMHEFLEGKNRTDDAPRVRAADVVSPDALALVRFGLRAADDPRIVATAKVIDAKLKTDFPTGPAWRRYNGDGYGEKENGDPFDGTGIGRPWPLLTGERAHYEIARGNLHEAHRLRRAMRSFANAEGLLPEQVWDADDVPDKNLLRGKAAGSAMPLVWAHAEYIKLCASLQTERIFDLPTAAAKRYIGKKVAAAIFVWRFDFKCQRMPAGRRLRIETDSAAVVHWSANDWADQTNSETRSIGSGMHFVDLPVAQCAVGAVVKFTFFWIDEQRWENVDFSVEVEAAK